MTDHEFRGFEPAAIQFLADLAANNDRAWFQPRKPEFERLLKRPMAALCAALAVELEARGVPLVADPDRSPFRIHRDTRFSRDKAPYKTNYAARFPWVDRGAGGEALDAGAHANGGYFNLMPGEPYVGGGMWMPEKPRLDAFRRAVVEDPERVRAAFEDPGFLRWFGPEGVHTHERYRRVPPGWPADHPGADLLRWKDVIFGRRLADEEVTSPDLPKRLADGYAAAMPVFRLLATLR